jgi:hypothetical protein
MVHQYELFVVRNAAFGTPVNASRATSNHSARNMLFSGRLNPVHTIVEPQIADQHPVE